MIPLAMRAHACLKFFYSEWSGKTEKFHQIIENKKKNAEQKIMQMKENALKDIKNVSVKISIETVKNLINNSIDKKTI